MELVAGVVVECGHVGRAERCGLRIVVRPLGERIDLGAGESSVQPAGGQATVTASGNTFHTNGTGANGETGTTVDAENNWWGCKQGANAGHCDTAVGTVDYTPWLTARP